jgi:hypothetical protein
MWGHRKVVLREPPTALLPLVSERLSVAVINSKVK